MGAVISYNTLASLLSLRAIPPFHPFSRFFFFFVCFGRIVRHVGILVPQPGMEPAPPAVEARSPNHWTAREAPPPQQVFVESLLLPGPVWVLSTRRVHTGSCLWG